MGTLAEELHDPYTPQCSPEELEARTLRGGGSTNARSPEEGSTK